MGSNSIIEMYTGLFGWLLYNRVWEVLNATGLAYLPFILLLVRALREQRSQGVAVTVRQMVGFLRVELLLALCVLMLFVLPVAPLTLNSVSSARVQVDCAAPARAASTPDSDTSSYASRGAFAVLNGNTVYVPVGWAVWQALVNGVTAAVIAGIPCGADLRGFQLKMAEQAIADPQVRRELTDFTRECYAATVALIQQDNMLRPRYAPLLSVEAMAWPGAPALLAHPLYNQRLGRPRADFPYDPVLDEGYGNAGGGHPTCAEWWAGGRGNAGLRSRLVAQVDPAVMARALDAGQGGIRGMFGGLPTAQIEDALLHSMMEVSDSRPLREGGALNNDYVSTGNHSLVGSPGLFTGIAATVGIATHSLAHYPKMMLLREALPIAKAMLVMALIALLPFVLVLSGYSLGAVATAAVALLGIAVFDVLWAIAYWMDNMLVRALEYEVGGFLGWLRHPQTTLVMDFMTSVLCVILPLFWLGMLGWVGVKTFNFVGAASISLIAPAGAAGEQGGAQAGGAMKKALMKGR